MRKWISLTIVLTGFTISSSFASLDACRIIREFTGEIEDGEFGFSVANAGDVNNDSVNDFVIGAPYLISSGNEIGRAYIISGSTYEVIYSFEGEKENDNFGLKVSTAGDVNGDGYDDIIVGAPSLKVYDSGPGKAYVFSGVNGGLLYEYEGVEVNDLLGIAVAAAGDVNNDGFSDFLIGSPGHNEFRGRVLLISGQAGDTLLVFVGDSTLDELGRAVCGVGDLDQDGFDDVMAGATGYGYHPGKAYVYSGQTGNVIHLFLGVDELDGFGRSLSSISDLDGDGIRDLIVGDDGYDSHRGKVYVFSGESGDLIYALEPDDFSQFGFSVSSIGDVDEDGFEEVVVGAYAENKAGQIIRGSVYIFSGFDGAFITKYEDNLDLAYFGISVANAGDVNSDGLDDIMVGAFWDGVSLHNAGKVYFLSVNSCFGNRGDLNHDGSDSNMLDLNFLVNRIFRSGPAPACSEEGDVNSDGISAN
ncbi:MAG TPA: integrin alpha, partial [candidate division Zixibacteria bacterium]|nr:integrin alpha [candidate division Zixibacteria bacterium]